MVGITHRSHVSVLLILLTCARDRDKEHQDPRDSDLEPHLQVNRTNTRVQAGTHEDVVNEVARHANLVSSRDSEEVHPERHAEADDHRDSHEMTEVVDDGLETDDSGVLQNSSDRPGDIDAADSVAFVHEGFVPEGRDGETFLHVTGDDTSECELESHESEVRLPRVGIGACILYRH